MILEYMLLTYKNPVMLNRAVRSVCAEWFLQSCQEHTPEDFFRLTIVDDCEIEATAEFGAHVTLEGYGGANIIQSNNTLKEKKNHTKSRMGKMLNEVVYSSDADLVMMLCDDDAIIPGASAKVVQWFKDHPEEQWAYGTDIGFDASAEGDFPGLPLYGENKPLVEGEPQQQETIPERTTAANVLGVQSVVWRRDAQVKHNIRWMDESHPKRNPIDHMVFHQMDRKFAKECPFIGFSIQYKGAHAGQVSRWEN